MRFLLYVSRSPLLIALYTVNFVNFSSLRSSLLLDTVTSHIDTAAISHKLYNTTQQSTESLFVVSRAQHFLGQKLPTVQHPPVSRPERHALYLARGGRCVRDLLFFPKILSLPACLETNSPKFVHWSCSS